MKNINEYRKSVTIYLVPSVRSGNSLRIEFCPPYEFGHGFTKAILENLRKLDFSCSESNSQYNSTQHFNVIDMILDLCVDERKVIDDVIEYLETYLGENSVLDRTRSTIKKENKQMKT